MHKNFWNNPKVITFTNVARIVLVILLIIIIVILVKEIEAIKLLAYDPCKLCMNKTGAVCYLPTY